MLPPGSWPSGRRRRRALAGRQLVLTERAGSDPAGAALLGLDLRTLVVQTSGGGQAPVSIDYAARAFELDAADDLTVGADYVERARALAGPVVVSVLARYPPAPAGGGRAGELMRTLDASLRQPATDAALPSR